MKTAILRKLFLIFLVLLVATVLLKPLAVAESENEAGEFEYKVEKPWGSRAMTEKKINEYAQGGWRLHTIFEDGIIFERKVK